MDALITVLDHDLSSWNLGIFTARVVGGRGRAHDSTFYDPVQGIINSWIGVFIDDRGFASVTHLPSGCRVQHGSFRDLCQAIRYAERLLDNYSADSIMTTPREDLEPLLGDI